MNESKELGAKRNPIIDALLESNPSIPHLTAAKMLHAEYPDLFTDVELARTAIRKRTGNYGKAIRDSWANTHGHQYRQPFTGDAMPAPRPFWDTTPFMLTSKRYLIIADAHIPFHEPGAIEIAVKHALGHGCRDVVLLGDILDHYQESDFSRVPDVATLTQELADGLKFFRWLRKKFKGRIVYKKGNHEERWQVRVHKAMPEVGLLMDNFTDEYMGLLDLGIDTVEDRRIIYSGYLNLLHGQELGRGAFNPVSAARLLQLKAKECAIVAHWHQSTVQRAKTIRDRQIGCWSVGCMCNLHPNYNPINEWQHGFAIVEIIDDAGGFIVENKVIIGGRAV